MTARLPLHEEAVADGIGRTLNLSQALEVSWLEMVKAARKVWADQDGAALGRAVATQCKESARMFEWAHLEKAGETRACVQGVCDAATVLISYSGDSAGSS